MRRLLRRMFIAGGVVIVLLGAAFGVLQSGWGKSRLADYISASISDPGVMELSIGDLYGLLPWSFGIAEVSISDASGPYLEIAKFSFELDVLEALSGHYRVSNAVVEGVRVLRLPDDGSAAPSRVDAPLIPLWPGELVLEDFRVADIWIAPELAGQSTKLRASGRIVPDAGEGVDIVLDVAGEPEGGLNAVVFLRHDPDADVVSLAAEVSEPAGGLLARLLELPVDAPVLMQVVGEGPADDWQGEVHAAFGDAEWSGTFAIENRTRVTLDGHANVLPFVEAGFRPLVGPDLRIHAVADIVDGEGIQIAEATFHGATSTLSVDGGLGLADGHADLAFGVQIPDLAPFALLVEQEATGAVRVAGTLRGPLRAPEFDAQVDLHDLAFEDYATEKLSLSLMGSINIGDAAATVRGTGRIAGIMGLPDMANVLVGPEVELAFNLQGSDAGPVTFEIFKLTGDNLALEGIGIINPDAQEIETQFSFRVPDVALLAANQGLEVRGRVAGQAKGAFALAGQTGNLDASLTIDEFDIGDEIARAIIGPTLQIDTSFGMEESGGIRVERLELRGRGAELAYSGAVAPGFASQNGRLQATIPDLAILSDALGTSLKGALHANATLDGLLEAPRVEGEVLATALNLDGFAIERAEAGFNAYDLSNTPAGAFDVRIEIPDVPALSVRSSYMVSEGEILALPDLVAMTSGGNSLAADLRIDLARELANGHADLTMENLAEVAALTDVELTGQAEAALALSVTGSDRQDAQFMLRVQDLALGGAPRVATLEVGGELTDLFGLPAFTARIDARGAESDGFTINTLHAELGGDLTRTAFDADLTGEMGEPVRFNLAGEASQDENAIAIRIDRLDGNAGDIPVKIRQALQARFGPGPAMRADGVLDVGGGDVTLAVSVGAETDANITVTALPLGLARAWLPLRAESGVLDANLRITGRSNDTRGTVEVVANDLQVDLTLDDVEVPPATATFSGAWGDGRMSAEAELSGVPGSIAAASATFPFSLSLAPFDTWLSPDDPMEAYVNVEGDLAQVSVLLPLGEDRLFGEIDAKINVSGSFAEPSLTGRGVLNDGRYESFDADAVIDGLNLIVNFDGQEIRVEKLTATDGDVGLLSGGGALMLGASDKPGATETALLAVRLDQFFLLRRDDILAPFTGDLTASLDAEGVALRGTLVSQPVEVRIPERLPPSSIDLNPTEINGGDAGTQSPPLEEAGREQPLAVQLGIGLTFPRQLFVRGRGLDSEWRGALNIGGTADAPVVSGKLDLIRGRFEFADTTFDLSAGSIQLDGADPPDPEINIVAESDAGEIVARVTISGRASAIELAIESDPPLPRDEILAHVLFGKSAGEISPFQAAQIARTLATLSGSGGPDIVGQVREVLGVDDIAVVNDGNGTSGAALSVGKYVVDGVYLRAQQGIAEESTKAGVEVEVTDSITVESDVGANATSSTWLNWQFKY